LAGWDVIATPASTVLSVSLERAVSQRRLIPAHLDRAFVDTAIPVDQPIGCSPAGSMLSRVIGDPRYALTRVAGA
jgi:hypothetical protein